MRTAIFRRRARAREPILQRKKKEFSPAGALVRVETVALDDTTPDSDGFCSADASQEKEAEGKPCTGLVVTEFTPVP